MINKNDNRFRTKLLLKDRKGCIEYLNENLVATSRQLTRILKSEDKLPHLLK